MRKAIAPLLGLIFLPATVYAQSLSSATVPVTVDNFVRAETDNYLAINAEDAGIGQLGHRREPASVDHQTVIRVKRDTLYSFGVFDLAAGPITVTLPDAGKRFMSLQIINDDHYVPFVAYDHTPHTLTKKDVGTRYVMVVIRTLVDPNTRRTSTKFTSFRTRLRSARKVPASSDSRTGIRRAKRKSTTLCWCSANTQAASITPFGAKDQVDPIKHLIRTAARWAAIRTGMRPISACPLCGRRTMCRARGAERWAFSWKDFSR
jgi:hypothetical protein